MRLILYMMVGLMGLRVQARQTRLVVDASGRGDFRTIQEAINSLPDDAAAPRVIFIRKGVYQEKVFIEKNNLVLAGEDKEQTIITYSLARDAWRCDHPDDWGVATLNLRGSDITLRDLTITNTYGFDHVEPQVAIDCAEGGVDFFKLGRYHRDAQFYLAIAPGAPSAGEINAKWVFGTKWDPL